MHISTLAPGARGRAVRPAGVNRLLQQRRIWFADEPAQADVTPQDEPGAQPPASEPQDVGALPAWAQALIKELRGEAAQNRQRAKAEETAKRAAEEERLKAQGEWQKLADERAARVTELEPKAALAEALLERVSKQNAARIAAVPEAMRTLIPANYDAVQLSEWLDANLDKLAAPKAPTLDSGARGTGGKPKPSPSEILRRTNY